MPIVQVPPFIDPKMRAMCVRPYEGHPKGCPNFNKKEGCPGKAPLCWDLFDLSKPTYFIYTVFDLAAHIAKMKAKHPEWSQRQLACCLYWQGTARKALSKEIEAFYQTVDAEPDELIVNRCPEALGINVTATMKRAGVILQWPPTTYTTHVAMAGWPAPQRDAK